MREGRERKNKGIGERGSGRVVEGRRSRGRMRGRRKGLETHKKKQTYKHAKNDNDV